jgi:hypothetical protein
MDILENIKLGGKILIWQKNTDYFKKKVKNSKGLNFLHHLAGKNSIHSTLFEREKN